MVGSFTDLILFAKVYALKKDLVHCITASLHAVITMPIDTAKILVQLLLVLMCP